MSHRKKESVGTKKKVSVTQVLDAPEIKDIIRAPVQTSRNEAVSLSVATDYDEENGQDNEYECDECQERFYFMQFYKQHIISHEESYSRHCAFCAKAISKRDSVEVHTVTMHMKQELMALRGLVKAGKRCEICAEEFNTNELMMQHFIISHSKSARSMLEGIDKLSNCNLPKNEFSEKKDILAFEKEHFEYKCKEKDCKETFSFAYFMGQHVAAAHNRRPQRECYLCFNSFPNKVHTLRHIMKVHMLPILRAISFEPGSCPLCARSFVDQLRYRLHMLRYHPANVKAILDAANHDLLADRSYGLDENALLDERKDEDEE